MRSSSAAPGARARALLVGAVCVAALAAGCGGTGAPSRTTPSSSGAAQSRSAPPATSASASASPSLSEQGSVTHADVSDTRGRRTRVTLRSAATDAAPVRAGLTAGTVAVTASLAPDDILTVTVAGARWTAYPDGSATLADDDAALVGGTQPTATDDNGVRRTTTRTEDDGRTLIIAVAPPVFPVPEPSAATAPGRPAHTTVTFAIAPRALVGATWADDVEGGRSLQVDPTAFGRSGSTAALEAVRAELVAAHTEAATTVMDHQLRCHALGAPDKTTWNLEPWRPEGSYLDYLLARCNPS